MKIQRTFFSYKKTSFFSCFSLIVLAGFLFSGSLFASNVFPVRWHPERPSSGLLVTGDTNQVMVKIASFFKGIGVQGKFDPLTSEIVLLGRNGKILRSHLGYSEWMNKDGKRIKGIHASKMIQGRVVMALKDIPEILSLLHGWTATIDEKEVLIEWKNSVVPVVSNPRSFLSQKNYKLSRQLANLPEKVRIRTVILDPGHGGKDGGAKGYRTGIHEKDIVLDIAKRLRKLLRTQLNMNVIMTREKDEFISLEDRAELASKTSSPIFISIHCNSVPRRHRRNVSGVETYVFSLKTGDKETEDLARREGIMEFKDGKGSSPFRWIMMKGNILESKVLAEKIQNSIVHRTHAIDRGIRNARFYVLHHTLTRATPAVLVETGFLSNYRESRKLASVSYRQKLAVSLYEGVLDYFQDVMKKYGNLALGSKKQTKLP